MKKLRLAGAAAAIALLSLPAGAQAPDSAQVRGWAAACAACHGTEGRAAPGNVPLAGMARDEMVRKLMDFKNGRAQATVMHQLAKGYSDEQIAAIAAWFAAQKR